MHGVWRSVDGGLSWTGVNDLLPNLPATQLLSVPSGARGVRLSVRGAFEVEWAPGEKTAWKPVAASDLGNQENIKRALSQGVNRMVTAFATGKNYIYAGDSEGRLQVSADAGVSWGSLFRVGDAGAVQAIWVDPNDPRVAIAALKDRATAALNQTKPSYVLRTMNGGVFWDDITANLPETAAAHGIAADRATGAIYVATDAGLFYTIADLATAGNSTSWISLGGNLPAAATTDVKLDAAGNQLYVALEVTEFTPPLLRIDCARRQFGERLPITAHRRQPRGPCSASWALALTRLAPTIPWCRCWTPPPLRRRYKFRLRREYIFKDPRPLAPAAA